MSLQFVTLFLFLDPATLVWHDPNHIYQIAQDLARGLPFSTLESEDNLNRAPGYPFLQSLLIRVVGTDLISIRVFHILLCPIIVPLTLYPEAILIALYVGLCVMMYRLRSGFDYVSVLIVLSLLVMSVMVRPTAIVWIPVIMFFVWRVNTSSSSSKLKFAIALVLVPTLAVFSWMYRNKDVHDAYLFTTTDQRNLLMSYNENGEWYAKTTQLSPEIEQRLQNSQGLNETREIVFGEVMQFIKDNPNRVVELFVMRFIGLWSPLPITEENPTISPVVINNSLMRWIGAGVFLCYLLLGAVGAMRLRRDPLIQTLFVLILLNTALNALFLVSVRFRLVTDFAVILSASAFIAQELRARRLASRSLSRVQKHPVKSSSMSLG